MENEIDKINNVENAKKEYFKLFEYTIEIKNKFLEAIGIIDDYELDLYAGMEKHFLDDSLLLINKMIVFLYNNIISIFLESEKMDFFELLKEIKGFVKKYLKNLNCY